MMSDVADIFPHPLITINRIEIALASIREENNDPGTFRNLVAHSLDCTDDTPG
jgi:hypothetical protein